jgi:hypothetical protein
LGGLPNLPKSAGVAVAKGVARAESLVKPPALPSTSGKTTVPSRTVTPAAAPKAKANPAAPKPPKPAPRKPPVDPAARAVQQALAPLYAAQGTQATQQNTAIANLTRAIIAQLQPSAGQVGGEYDQAIGQQTNLANSAADRLAAANPNTQDQALLSAINAPDAQRAQLAAQNSAAFNGGAAVGSYVGGVLPVSSLQSQKLAAMGLAHQMPVIEALRGQQSLSAALANQSADKAKIDALRPDLLQRYQAADVAAQNAKVAQAQKQAYLNIASQSLGLRAQNQQFGQGLAKTKLVVQQRQFIARQRQQAATFNARQTTAQAKLTLPNASLSSKVGYLVDGTGAPINGKITPLPGYRIVNSRVVKQGAKARAGSKLSAVQVQKFKGEAATIASNAANGFDGKDPVTGNPKHFPPLSRMEAWKELMKHGVPETVALAALNRVYTDPNPATNPNALGPPAP